MDYEAKARKADREFNDAGYVRDGLILAPC